MQTNRPSGRNIALELVRATEAAAIRATPWVGRGDKIAADQAAVDAMRAFLSTVDIDGTIVIGEGEKDAAPMLYNGESVGTGIGPALDIAVDPIDGTSLAAAGRPNAIATLAASSRGSMFDASACFYMDKIVTDRDGIGVVKITLPIEENIAALAHAKQKPVSALQIAVLDRPRHHDLIRAIRSTGASTRLLLDGDVAGGVNAARDNSPIDMCVGVGGSPEGIITACAVKALGGHMQAVLKPENYRGPADKNVIPFGGGRVWDQHDLVTGNNAIFVITGITSGDLVRGTMMSKHTIRTESLVLRSASGTMRRIITDHPTSRWLDR